MTRSTRPGAAPRRVEVAFVALVTVATMLTAPTQAYLDPGTGSIMLQAILGGVATGAIVLRRYWRSLSQLFGAGPRDATGPDDSQQPGR